MNKRRSALSFKRKGFKVSRSRIKNRIFIKRLERNREIIGKDNIKIEIKLVRSLIGKLPNKIKTIKALGLSAIGDKRIFILNNSIKGMLNKTINMILINEVKL